MKNISSRRQIITVVLLALALAGGVLRWWAPRPSLARDLGSLLLVLWLPIIGNIIAWLVARAHTLKAMPPTFDPASAFTPSGTIVLTLLPAGVPKDSRPVHAGLFNCTVVVGSEAFTARLQVLPDAPPLPGVATALPVQFLRPELALPKLAGGVPFALLSGRLLLGRGVLVDAPAPA